MNKGPARARAPRDRMARVQVSDETWAVYRTGLGTTPVSVAARAPRRARGPPRPTCRLRRQRRPPGGRRRQDRRQGALALIARLGRHGQRLASPSGASSATSDVLFRLMPEPPLLSVPQVAEEFQVTAQTIRNWIDQGVLPAIRVGRAFRINRSTSTHCWTVRERTASRSRANVMPGRRNRSGCRAPTSAQANNRSGMTTANRKGSRSPGPEPRPNGPSRVLSVRAHFADHPWPASDTLSQAPRSAKSSDVATS